ncbi:MAG: M28 family peptidase [Chitinophagaceae bacterium]|nr:M28 family peptidase [Chitinophagaceae bacterium]
MKKNILLFLFIFSAFYNYAQRTKLSLPAIAAIRPSELERDLKELTDDHFRGREAGTPDELKASVWLAEKAREAGLSPAGDDGTFFQFFSLQRNKISDRTTIRINNESFTLWKDVLLPQTAEANVNAPLLFLDVTEPSQIDSANIRGKAVVIMASREGLNLDISLPERRYPGFVLRKYSSTLINNGAAAIIFIADEAGEKGWQAVLPAVTRGNYDIEGGPNAVAKTLPPVLWFHKSAESLLKQPGAMLHANVIVERYEYPSVNIVGTIKGTDPVLSKEYVLFSGHQDHDGIRTPYGNDSIYNGADDNATTCVAMLAIARTFKAQPSKRSVLFVWHGAEERGLLGSKWYASHPTVPNHSIVAVMNADMIGRNNPDSAALLGASPPHMNSRDMVEMAHEANREGPKFLIDTLWDRPEHPEYFYFRSDHLPYARLGIPAIYFTTTLHDEYHTPMDDASGIDIRKLTRMTQWIYRTGWKIANRPQKPRLVENFKLER